MNSCSLLETTSDFIASDLSSYHVKIVNMKAFLMMSSVFAYLISSLLFVDGGIMEKHTPNQPKRLLYDHYLLFSFIDCFGFRELYTARLCIL